MKSNKKNYRKNSNKKSIQIDKPLPIKKLRIILFCTILLLSLLIIRLFWLQFIDGAKLKEKAYRQQTASKIISPKRGSILDVNGKSLAMSEEVDTISINPSRITVDKKILETKGISKQELVAQGLSDIFELDYNEVLEKVNSSASVETIIKKVETDKVKELENWMTKNKIRAGINIDADNKRCYPYNEIASQLIGFCGTDNQGLAGIEASYDNILTGRSGKIVTTTDLNNSEISDEHSTYVAVENGSDVYLTIDINIQTIVEKYIKKSVEDKECEYATSIIMEPSTGNILAMSTYPNFNLNTPFEPNTEEAKKNWDTMTSTEKSTFLNQMWRNKNVSDTYEPGSTFKTLISAIALEENITETDIQKDFYCKGYEDINGTKIRCWSTKAHGYETLTQALANSCNPAFMQLGKRIGVDTFYKYFEAFGLFTKTGISLPGEATKGIFLDKERVKQVELATMSFGQRFKITPLQLITAVSSLANDGILVKPQIISKTVNKDTGSITSTQTAEVRQVVSKETADSVIDMMEYVVTNGTGNKGSVKGYTIAGKTGTSESIAGSNQGNTLSYIAVAPSENPCLVALVVLYNTPSTNSHGSTVAGPIVSNILSEVLPYLGVTSDEANINSNNNSVTVPNIINKTVTEAEKILKNAGLNAIIACDGDKNSTLVTAQVPSARTMLMKDSVVLLYSEENATRTSVTVPDLTGLTLTQAKVALKKKNLNISYTGTGIVASQSIKQGNSVEEGTVINVTLSY